MSPIDGDNSPELPPDESQAPDRQVPDPDFQETQPPESKSFPVILLVGILGVYLLFATIRGCSGGPGRG